VTSYRLSIETLRWLKSSEHWSDGANINVTLSPEVEKGSPVSIRLNKVTYEQAMKSILEAYKFGSVFENGILKIDTLANLNAIREEKLKEKESAWKILPTKRLVWQVNYAKAVELQPILETMLKGYKVDPRFSIVSDKRTNKLVIEGIADALVEAKAILENLDKRKQQVLIEARIVEASNELSKTLSITWGTRFGFDGNRGLANGLIFPNSLTGNIGGAGALGSNAPNPGLATLPTQLGTLQFTVGSINNLINMIHMSIGHVDHTDEEDQHITAQSANAARADAGRRLLQRRPVHPRGRTRPEQLGCPV